MVQRSGDRMSFRKNRRLRNSSFSFYRHCFASWRHRCMPYTAAVPVNIESKAPTRQLPKILGSGQACRWKIVQGKPRAAVLALKFLISVVAWQPSAKLGLSSLTWKPLTLSSSESIQTSWVLMRTPGGWDRWWPWRLSKRLQSTELDSWGWHWYGRYSLD